MASNPPARCCTLGVKHEGEPTGTLTTLENNIAAYIAEPTSEQVSNFGTEKKAILYLPDVIGIWQNSKLMADVFAQNGYYTLMPDLFNGDPVSLNRSEDFDLMAWLIRGTGGNNPHTPEFVDPIVASAIKFLHAKGYNHIASVGYCFGAKYVVRFMSSTPPIAIPTSQGAPIQVGYSAHPSFVDEEELAAIKGPFSISAAETDSIFPAEKRWKSEEILAKTGQEWQINLQSGVEHGYAVRADLSSKHAKFAKEQAFKQAVEWIRYHL